MKPQTVNILYFGRMNFKYIVLLLFLPFLGLSQITENFNDGNFTDNPTWTGDAAEFNITSNQLRLNSAGTDTSYLGFESTVSLNAEWKIWVKLSFNPSSGNHARIYLSSDQTNLKGSLNGYFVQLGGVGTVDDIRLFRQDGTSVVELIDGPDSTVAGSTNEIRLKITRTNLGEWSVLADSEGGENFEPQGTVTDNTHATSQFFGVWCKYTSSNATKFYFDDIYAGPIIVDSIAPGITKVVPVSSSVLDVYFDESVTAESAQNALNYSINNGIGSPLTATHYPAEPNKVRLILNNTLQNQTTYTLTTTSIEDVESNSAIRTRDFVYYEVKPYDVVFNELFPDPTPSVGLPPSEFIEIYNQTTYPIPLKNWTLQHASTVRTLPDVVILPDSFLILVAPSNFGDYIDFPNAVIVPDLNYQALSNDGQTLILRDTAFNIIHSVSYTSDWYNNDDKKDGGFSIEQIDPNNPCGGVSNWQASEATIGGTPGKRNSLQGLANPDTKSPEALRIIFSGPQSITILFSESLDSSSATVLSSYSVDNGFGNPSAAIALIPNFTQVTLSFNTPFLVGIIYNLTINSPVYDCVGNALQFPVTLRFAIPEPPAVGDLVINEILPDPFTNGHDFVEIYNKSSKNLDLKDLLIASYDDEGQPEDWYVISEEGFLLFPGEFVAISENSESVKSQYLTPNPNNVITVNQLPSFNIDEGSCIIADTLLNIIDAMRYDSDMHFALLKSSKGVSFERLNPERNSLDRDNWRSAAETVGYATPGYINSQFNENSSSADFVVIEPPIFSPDNDGYQDILNITLNLENPESVGNIWIYDAKGILITQLVENKLLGITNVFSWDGVTNRGDKARIGMYILVVETFDAGGIQKKAKKSFVIGGRI